MCDLNAEINSIIKYLQRFKHDKHPNEYDARKLLPNMKHGYTPGELSYPEKLHNNIEAFEANVIHKMHDICIQLAKLGAITQEEAYCSIAHINSIYSSIRSCLFHNNPYTLFKNSSYVLSNIHTETTKLQEKFPSQASSNTSLKPS